MGTRGTSVLPSECLTNTGKKSPSVKCLLPRAVDSAALRLFVSMSPAATLGDLEATRGAGSMVTGLLSESRRGDRAGLWVLGAGAGHRTGWRRRLAGGGETAACSLRPPPHSRRLRRLQEEGNGAHAGERMTVGLQESPGKHRWRKSGAGSKNIIVWSGFESVPAFPRHWPCGFSYPLFAVSSPVKWERQSQL